MWISDSCLCTIFEVLLFTCKINWILNFSSFATESSASLYTSAKSNLKDRVLGEVEKDSFITLPGKGGCSRLLTWKTMCPNPRGFDEVFYNSGSRVGSLTILVCVCRACTPLISSQVVGLLILMSFSGPFSLASGGFLAALPLISICSLNLPFGTQGRSWRLESWLQETGDKKSLQAGEPHRAPLDFSFFKYLAITLQTNVSNFLPPFWFGITKKKTSLEAPWKGPYQVLLTTQMAAKFQGLDSWVHTFQLKRVPPGSWNCVPTGDLKFKLTREVSLQKQRALWRGELCQGHTSRSSFPKRNLYSFCLFATSLCKCTGR